MAVADELNQTANALAHVDVFTAWGALAREKHYCCPLVDKSNVFEVIAGRHPIVETALRENNAVNHFVENDLQLDCANEQIMILTGPNMAGKSTYIRQNALIALMAHIGHLTFDVLCHSC